MIRWTANQIRSASFLLRDRGPSGTKHPHAVAMVGESSEVLELQQMEIGGRYRRMASIEKLDRSSGLIAWAFHSDCQETLFSSILSAKPSCLRCGKLVLDFGTAMQHSYVGRHGYNHFARSNFSSKETVPCHGVWLLS
ncbi:hypothetical protein Droror1_Dr00001194 [Drosera rotundifolia]